MIESAKLFNLRHKRMWLLPEKAMYWQKEKILLVADLHIGKSAHFRKNGIAVPQKINHTNLHTLSALMEKVSPKHLVLLGDLFHSDFNNEWKQFVAWRKQFHELDVSLVIGNHDILSREKYHANFINVFNILRIDPFIFVHDIESCNEKHLSADEYILSGHIHPAVKLQGRGRQTMKLPCFYFGDDYGILPAFGAFTGTYVLEPQQDDRIFMVADQQILSDKQLHQD